MRLTGKIALVSGAGRNNGRAIALAFAREGADLILVARMRDKELREVAGECESFGVRTLSLLADMGRPEEVNRVVECGLQRFGRVDVSVSVAGIRPHKNFWEYGYEEWQQIFAVNLHSTFFIAKALAPGMMERRSGSIIALGSMASMTALPTAAVEVACKHGLYGLIKSLALELGPYGVRANLLALGDIENKRLYPEWYQHTGGASHTTSGLASSPLGRQGRNQEVANVALFLASDDSSYVTGDRILCAGGRFM